MASALRVFPSPARDRRAPLEIEGVIPASRLGVRPQPETIPTSIPQVDKLTGGVPRGGLTEIFGPASSGRTSLLLALLAQTTAREEVCALVDASDAFDPHSAAAAGVDLKRLLWVRCGRKVSSSPFLVSRKNRASAEEREARNEKLASVEQALRAAIQLHALDTFHRLGGAQQHAFSDTCPRTRHIQHEVIAVHEIYIGVPTFEEQRVVASRLAAKSVRRCVAHHVCFRFDDTANQSCPRQFTHERLADQKSR